ncbi:MAG TPA: phage major capsid protein [Armatimonadota bacterium]|jgi:HK97 family phage major capsid protein
MKTTAEYADAIEAKQLEIKAHALESQSAETPDMAKLDQLDAELKSLTDGLAVAKRLEDAAAKADASIADLKKVTSPAPVTVQSEIKNLGSAVVSSKAFRALAAKESDHASMTIDLDLKTAFTSSAGMAPQITRTGEIVETINYPLTIVDALDQIPALQPTVRIQQETLTATAQEIAEAGGYPEGAISFADVDFTVRKIGSILPISDEELEDIPALENLINSRIVFDVISRLNNQLVNGAGTGTLVKGMLHTDNVSTANCGTGSLNKTGSRAIFLAKQKLAVSGACVPNVVIINPDDWGSLVTEVASSSGVYMNTAAISTEPDRIWGMRVVQSDRVAVGTVILFDSRFVQLRPLRGIDVQIGYNGTDFGTGKKSIRADIRTAFVVKRPQAILVLTTFSA